MSWAISVCPTTARGLRVRRVLVDPRSEAVLDRGWESGLRAALLVASAARDEHPLIAAVLACRFGDTTLLPLVTTRNPVLGRARVLVSEFLGVHRPALTATYLADVADVVVRSVVSHLASPEIDRSAVDRLHRITRHLLTHPPDGAIRSGVPART